MKQDELMFASFAECRNDDFQIIVFRHSIHIATQSDSVTVNLAFPSCFPAIQTLMGPPSPKDMLSRAIYQGGM